MSLEGQNFQYIVSVNKIWADWIKQNTERLLEKKAERSNAFKVFQETAKGFRRHMQFVLRIGKALILMSILFSDRKALLTLIKLER